MKKWMMLIALGAILGSLIAGCSQPAAEGGDANAPAANTPAAEEGK